MAEKGRTGYPGDIESRLAELARLRDAKGSQVTARFVRALRDGDLAVARLAAIFLSRRKAILNPLRQLIRSADPDMRWRACSLAWWIPLPAFTADLVRALGDREAMVRAEAAWGLRWADSDAAVRALLRATRDPSRMVAHYAAWVLRRNILPRRPRPEALKGRVIPDLPLLAERRPPGNGPASSVTDDAAAFEQFACSVDLPVHRAPLADAPQVDGRRDGCYRRSAEARLVHMDGYPQPPERKTDFRVVCSAGALHFHVRCRYRQQSELAARCTGYGQPVYADNSIDIFLDPSGTGRGRYFQISLNTRNARCDVIARAPVRHTWQPEGRQPDMTSWRPKGIRTAVHVERDCWNAELTIPFADLRLHPGRINKVWRMNVTRNAHLQGFYEVTSWCDLGDADAHCPKRFGYLWVDAGNVVNADPEAFRAAVLPLRAGLEGWTVIRGQVGCTGGQILAGPAKTTLRWDRPVPFRRFEVAADIQMRHQVRFLFAADRENSALSFDGACLNLINEVHFAHLKDWNDWAPEYPGTLTIFQEVYPRLRHSRWYRLGVRLGARRAELLLDGAVHIEMPRPPGEVRYFGVTFVGGGRLRKLHFRPLD